MYQYALESKMKKRDHNESWMDECKSWKRLVRLIDDIDDYDDDGDVDEDNITLFIYLWLRFIIFIMLSVYETA
jgi:hypothetical protein